MNKYKQGLYTLLLILTCFVASPFIFRQIWKTSAEAKKQVAPPPVVQQNDESRTDEADAPEDGGDNIVPAPAPGESAEPGAEASQLPEGTTAEPATEAPTEPDIFVESDIAYFDDALFIGDSRTVGISEYGTLKNADYFCSVGLTSVGVVSEEIDGRTFDEVIDSRQYGKVYIMLGINEVGNDFEYTLTAYRAVVERVKVHQPDAIIYVCANLHVSTWAENGSVTNANIDYLNSRIAQLADGTRVFYIDINEVYDDEYGELNPAYTNDGVHPLGMYYQQWCDWLCSKTVPDGRYYTDNSGESSYTDEQDVRYYTEIEP